MIPSLWYAALVAWPAHATLASQTGWNATEIVNVKCPENLNWELCMRECGVHGGNRTVAFYEEYCLKKLPPDQPLLVTRDRRYGTGSGRLTFRGNTLGDVYHLKLGWLWGLELSNQVDLSHWERITRAVLYMDEHDHAEPSFYGGEPHIPSNTPINIFKAAVQTGHFKDGQGKNDWIHDSADAVAYVNSLDIDNPNYRALGWDSTDAVFKALNLTRWLREEGARNGTLGQGIVIQQPWLEHMQQPDRGGYVTLASEATLYLDVHEEVWVRAELHCGSFDTCADCVAQECTWCLTSSLRSTCVKQCNDLWENNDECGADSVPAATPTAAPDTAPPTTIRFETSELSTESLASSINSTSSEPSKSSSPASETSASASDSSASAPDSSASASDSSASAPDSSASASDSSASASGPSTSASTVGTASTSPPSLLQLAGFVGQ